ncbi:T9SS type A sorting domain-containing protein [Psychroserpens sp. XS_ASV72]|uniref:T9SS type A sorting domain-containing protein n=1 Tax=Psychroserpens sp. XS_ASV72 TaxID=3241293 RepID=UPI00351440E4
MKQQLLFIAFILCYLNSTSQTTFSAKQPINTSTGDAPFVIDSGLLDADAFVDIVIGTYLGNTVEWYKNNGDGTFTLQPLISSSILECGSVKIADLNGDGYNDVLASNFADDELVWFANDGSGNFGTEQIISSSIDGSSGIVTGFIDSGTTVDVAVVAFNSGDTVWFSNDGSGNFTGPNSIASVSGSGPGNLDLADFDDDGDLDAVIMNSGIGTFELYYNNLVPSGSVSFTIDPNTVTSGEVYPFDVRFADVDGDMNLDIIAVDLFGGASGLGWYKKEMDGTFSETIIPTSIANPSTAMFEDMDNDGIKDIVLSSGTSGAGNDITWFKNLGSGSFGAEQVIDNTQSQAYAFTIADFDNDGDKDIANIAYNNDDLNWFENELITLSLSSSSTESIAMFPNPAVDFVNFKGIDQEINVVIYNMIGDEVSKATLNNHQTTIDIKDLSSGVYIVEFEGFSQTKRLIKQ